MLFGVMPRSGSVHVGEIIALHPAVCAHPNHLWEVPFLENLDQLVGFRDGFFRGYELNKERMGQADLPILFATAFVRYLYSFAESGQRVLTKETSTQYLELFPEVFPHEHLLLLLRDGRDLVASSKRTWPTKSFAELCQRWSDSTHRILDFVEREKSPNHWVVKFESVLADRIGFVAEMCDRFGLERDDYPDEKQADIEVIGSSTLADAGDVDWSKRVKPPAEFKPTNHWMDWNSSDKRVFKKLAGEALVRSGYAENLDW